MTLLGKMNLISLKVMIMEPPTTTQLQLQLFLKVHFRCRKDKLIELLTGKKLFSLTMDGSTDSAVVEQETLFFRASINGKIVTRIGEPNSTSSVDLYTFVKDSTKENGF